MARPNSTTALRAAVNKAGSNQPAIAALVVFAQQRSGIDPRDYGFDPNGRKAYRNEVRDISADLRRFRQALKVAVAEGVTDADVIAEAPYAFSGRLEWKSHKAKHYRQTDPSKYGGAHKGGTVASEIDVWGWEYCTGQYFPTEYRKAAATLLEYATRRVRQARPPETADRITTIAQLKALNERNGGCWFGQSEMRFFGTSIQSEIIRGKYFITRDKRGFEESAGYGYTIRHFDKKGNITRNIGELAEYDSKWEALEALRKSEGK